MPNESSGSSVLGSARIEVLSVNKGLADMGGSKAEFAKHFVNRKAELEALIGPPDGPLSQLVYAELATATEAMNTAMACDLEGAPLAAAIEARLRV